MPLAAITVVGKAGSAWQTRRDQGCETFHKIELNAQLMQSSMTVLPHGVRKTDIKPDAYLQT